MVLAFAVALATLGALFIAVGSALQERVVAGTRAAAGQMRFVLSLARHPRWLLGGVCAGVGVALHVLALSHGPVSIIQPVGTTGLLFAVVTKALLDRRGVRPAELLGSTAIVLGLAGLLTALPHDPKDPTLSLAGALALGSGTLLVTGVAALMASTTDSSSAKAALLAFAAGSAFGVGSALVGVIGHRALADPSAVLGWPTVVVLMLLACGALAQQHAYRMRRFALAFAVLLITDPVVAASVGVLVLGEPMPGTAAKAAWMGVSATVVVAGVVALARSYAAASPSSVEEG
nr:DMT family transporter [Saccharomonospora saliphila]